VLRRIFGPKMEEVLGDWRRLHNEGFHNLYTSLNIVRVIKSRGMRWARHVAHMGETRNEYIFVTRAEGRDYSENLVTDRRIILYCICGGESWT
jgi:hypothetical protein